MTTPPTSPPCWPNSKDWLDGKSELEEGLPRSMRAEWDADILDLDDRNKHDRIIEQDDKFLVRFRVQLQGRLWKAIIGTWCFDLGFTAIGKSAGPSFDLSEKLSNPGELCVDNWTGCTTRCILVEIHSALGDRGRAAGSPATAPGRRPRCPTRREGASCANR